MKKVVATTKAPGAIGPYSQAIVAGDNMYISGQLPINPATGELAEANIQAQTKQSLENIKAILESEGLSMKNVVKTTGNLPEGLSAKDLALSLVKELGEEVVSGKELQLTKLLNCQKALW